MPWWAHVLWILVLINMMVAAALAIDPVQLPPRQYDHPFDGRVDARSLDWNHLEEICGRNRYACARIKDGECQIALPRVGVGGVSERTAQLLYRHEVGHCNGWRH